jgi:SNF2 family DNA or RNA helicase
MLSKYMIRRTHADEFMGRPLLQLPEHQANIFWCTFNELERCIYEVVRSRMIKRINRLSRSRQLDANYSNILTMLLRLRQLTGHILTVEHPIKDLLEWEDIEKLAELAEIEAAERYDSDRKQLLVVLRSMLNDQQQQKKKKKKKNKNKKGPAGEAGVDTAAERFEVSNNTGRQHGLQFDFRTYLASLTEGVRWEELKERTTCTLCNKHPEKPFVTSCFHIFCESCLNTLQISAAANDEDFARCPECQTQFKGAHPCDEFDVQSAVRDPLSDSEADVFRKRKKRTDKSRHEDDTNGKDWIDREGVHILPSSKTMAVKAQILNWIEETPNVKIIIYTQFLNMIRILAIMCQVEGWTFTTYHGKKSHEQRSNAIKEFRDPNKDTRILIGSLKAGGVGLNLTMAQRVIVVDPWWNSAVEQQAFGRVFRFGQEEETRMTRFVVRGTVDENMIRMQERKNAMIEGVMDGKKPR